MIEGFLLHLAARAALRFQPPEKAKRTVDAIGRHLRPLRTPLDAQVFAAELAGGGTCLSRALAIASRWPGSEVIIGANTKEKEGGRFTAHAWVETGGVVVGETDSNREITRLR